MSWLLKDKWSQNFICKRETFSYRSVALIDGSLINITLLMCSVDWIVKRIVTKSVSGIVKLHWGGSINKGKKSSGSRERKKMAWEEWRVSRQGVSLSYWQEDNSKCRIQKLGKMEKKENEKKWFCYVGVNNKTKISECVSCNFTFFLLTILIQLPVVLYFRKVFLFRK